MLARCYKAELSKLIKGKGIYIALGVMLVLIIAVTIFANMLDGVIHIPGVDTDSALEALLDVPREKYDEMIGTLESELEQLQGDNNTSWSRFADAKAFMESKIALLKYLKAHPDVDPHHIAVPTLSTISIGKTSFNFMTSIIAIVTEIAIFYAVIMMSTIFAGEYKDGTLKMQLLRPNSRNAIFTSKWLATFTISAGILIVGVILSALFAAFKFKFNTAYALCIIADTNIVLMHEGVFILLQVLFSLITIFALIQFSAFICSISKYNRSVSVAVPIVVLLFGSMSAYLLQIAYLGIIDFVMNINLITFILPGAHLPHVSLYSALIVDALYIAGFMTTNYLVFDKTEV